MERKKVIAGNWKMNMTASEGAQLIADIRSNCGGACGCACAPEVMVFPPFTSIAAVQEAAKGTALVVGAQNVHWAENGAFTGEISAKMLVEMGVTHVIIGHSERRQYFGETDETVNKRVKAALAAGLKVVLCVGETLEEREKGVTEAISVDMGCVGDGLRCTERQVSICAKDSGGPYSYEVVGRLIDAARREKADYAVDVYPHYGSDVEATLSAGNDLRHGLIGAGVYASHGYERSHIDGVWNTLKVLKGYLEI